MLTTMDDGGSLPIGVIVVGSLAALAIVGLTLVALVYTWTRRPHQHHVRVRAEPDDPRDGMELQGTLPRRTTASRTPTDVAFFDQERASMHSAPTIVHDAFSPRGRELVDVDDDDDEKVQI